MGNQQKRDAQITLQILQFNLHLAAQLAVKSGQRFIKQQYSRPIDQRTRQGHALLLAT